MRIFLFPLVIVSIFFAGCDLLGVNKPNPKIPGKIVFSKEDKAGDYSRIFTMNTDGSGLKKIADFKGFSSYQPSWGPNGEQIVFVSAKMGIHAEPAIFLMDADGSNKRPMKVYPDSPSIAFGGSVPVLSPDGSKIAYEICTNCGGAGGSNFEIMVYDLSADSLIRVTNNYWPDRHPSWSPEGNKLVFSSGQPYRDMRGIHYDLYIISIENRQETRITYTGDAFYPNWSPDGKYISYQTAIGGVQAYLYDIATGTHHILLPDFNVSGGVQWSKGTSILSVQTAKSAETAEEIRFFNFENKKLDLLHVQKDPIKSERGSYKWYYDENE